MFNVIFLYLSANIMADNRCEMNDCRKRTYPLGFHCKFCCKTFCLKHQLPENHDCDIKGSKYYLEYKTKEKHANHGNNFIQYEKGRGGVGA